MAVLDSSGLYRDALATSGYVSRFRFFPILDSDMHIGCCAGVRIEEQIMLPSFRLIAATFLCSFFVVFVGLRMAASLNDIHEGLPVMAAHAAPMSMAPAADRDARRGVSSVPVMYDLRFAVSPVSPILVRTAPALIERPVPQLPLAILPPDIPATEAAEPAAQPEATVAAIDRDADIAPAPSAIPESPSAIVSEPLPPLESTAETPAPDSKAAAIEPQNAPEPDATPAEPLVAEPETTQSVDVPIPAQDTAAAKPAEPATKPEPEHAKAAHAKPKAVAKPKQARKPRIRTARRATPSNNSFAIGNPASSPFGGPTRTQ
jgi:hypothetical protein